MRAIRPVIIRSLLFLGTVVSAFSLGVVAQSPTSAPPSDSSKQSVSLGDLARQQRSAPHSKAKRVITDDNIAAAEGTDAALSQPVSEKPAEANDGEAKGGKDKDKALSPEEKEKERAKPFLAAIDAQKKRIEDAQKKIQDLNEERRQRASAQYSDMGVLLRDPQKWNKDEKTIQDEIAEQQKEVDDAKAQLDDARERARKNGIRLPY